MPTYDSNHAWWQATWTERERLLKDTFGETAPNGEVHSFRWDNLDSLIPGGCALVFPPVLPERPDWLTISHGLTQPLNPPATYPSNDASGYGYEFGFLNKSHASWCRDALWLLMTYLRQSRSSIERGHRLPMWFSPDTNHSHMVNLGKPPQTKDTNPFGGMRAIIFWPYMSYPAGFTTSTGYFSILVGTTITESEWELAKATSSSHLLLILFEAGIGQASYLSRASITDCDIWRKRSEEIRDLPSNVVDEMLLDRYGPV